MPELLKLSVLVCVLFIPGSNPDQAQHLHFVHKELMDTNVFNVIKG